MTANRFRVAATIIALIPMGFVLMFAVGEGLDGWPHYVTALVLAALIMLAWKRPTLGGGILGAIAIACGILYAATAHQAPLTLLLVESILFAPLAVAGAFFLKR